jgi:hypothetical protein
MQSSTDAKAHGDIASEPSGSAALQRHSPSPRVANFQFPRPSIAAPPAVLENLMGCSATGVPKPRRSVTFFRHYARMTFLIESA